MKEIRCVCEIYVNSFIRKPDGQKEAKRGGDREASPKKRQK